MASTYANRRAGDAAAVQVCLGDARLPASNSRRTEPTQALHAELIGSDTCTAAGITARGQAPGLALCRGLIAAGLNPDAALEVFRAGILALRIRSIGEGAKLTVRLHVKGEAPFYC